MSLQHRQTPRLSEIHLQLGGLWENWSPPIPGEVAVQRVCTPAGESHSGALWLELKGIEQNSHILMCMHVTWAFVPVQMLFSRSGWNLRFCVSCKLPGVADAACLWPHFAWQVEESYLLFCLPALPLPSSNKMFLPSSNHEVPEWASYSYMTLPPRPQSIGLESNWNLPWHYRTRIQRDIVLDPLCEALSNSVEETGQG